MLTTNLSSLASSGVSSTTDFIMPQEETVVQKRPHQTKDKNYGEPPVKIPALTIPIGTGFKWNLQTLMTAATAVESGAKSPVSALNELGLKVSYNVLRQGGPAHCPSFTVAVTVADMTFEGWGSSKREARANAARMCLGALLARVGRVLPTPPKNHDFTSDQPSRTVSEFQCLVARMNSTANAAKPESAAGQGRPAPPIPPGPSPSLFGVTPSPPLHKSPINLLYETYPGLNFTCTFGDGSSMDAAQAPGQLSHSMRFKVVCQIRDMKFEGYAKLAAARSALAALDNRAEKTEPAAPEVTPDGTLPQTLADQICKLVNEKFNDLVKNDVVHSRRKVLAGIVMTIDNRMDCAKVIAVTTGTKCVSGEHISVSGRAVNDCHAEVIARRCLQRYLYSQLLMYASQSDPKEPIPDSDIEPCTGGGYHTAPCGDGRIFSPHENHETEPDRHPNRLARGQLRTKIESGEGTIPVKNCESNSQTWDGVLQGERLLTMSCSDKVARWCVLGLQGSLLSMFMKPVYLDSLVLGSLLHHHHLYRPGRLPSH
ncbi:hypothetical protein K1T71_014374 [Dendrolimus kikuchii]|uniref:Uncharacterized protein n=1 Tax=Dendrolimus kikuchii TaxID=765133 RepID=A0ACC1CE28_9NEOP|nr:hypothetical protein K1T71_014374 [Dendrolimus kikuchii]